MRLRSLHLERYGMFEGRRLDFPGDRMCLVYGSNEAGKSTALSAVSDLLYGFPHLTSFDFRFSTRDLRLGGMVENDKQNSESFRRKKGRIQTLLDEKDAPLPDDFLASFLGRSDRELFERTFGLDHERLREGGHAMLQAEGDIGESLIEAGSGINDLLEIQRALQFEADSIYTERRVQSKPFYQALSRYDEARKALRQHTLNATDWQKAERDVADKKATHEELQANLAGKRAEASLISRCRRTLPLIREVDQHLAAAERLAAVPSLPADAGDRRIKALDAVAQAEALQQRHSADAGEIKRQLDGCSPEQAVLRHAEEVLGLYELRGEIIANERDIPRRQAELESAQSELSTLSLRLGFAKAEDMESLQPNDLNLVALREAIEQGLAHALALKDAKEATAKGSEELASTERNLEALGSPSNPSALRREVEALRARATAEQEAASLEAEVGVRQNELSEALTTLGLWKDGVEELARASLPPVSVLRQFHAEMAELRQKVEATARQRAEALEAIEAARHRREAVEAAGEVPTPDALTEARRERDLAWAAARRLLTNQDPPGPAELTELTGGTALEEHIEVLIHHADTLADRREAEAQRIAQHASAVADLAAGERKLTAAEGLASRTAADLTSCEARWEVLWGQVGIEPHGPEAMLDWSSRAGEVLRLHKEYRRDAARLLKIKQQVADGLSRAKKLARDLEGSADLSGSLLEAVALLSAKIDELQDAWSHYRELQLLREDRKQRLEEAKKKQSNAEELFKAWKDGWQEILSPFGMKSSLTLQQAESALGLWQEVRSQRSRTEDLSHRIEAMTAASKLFSTRVAALSDTIGSTSSSSRATDTVAEMFELLRAQQSLESQHKSLLQRLKSIEVERKKARDLARSAESEIAALIDLAGLADSSALEDVIRDAEEKRDRQEKLKVARDRLISEGDGFGEEQLRAEAANLEGDDLQHVEMATNQEIDELTTELSAAATELEQSRQRRSELRAGGTAEGAAQDVESALADLTLHAGDWARARAASILLKEVIDRFRREHQDPLLTKAGEIFQRITLGSFDRFAVEYDEKDQPRLVGHRPDGSLCPVAGMSDGTRDQLYLSLRLAALEAYCRSEEPLPFIGDDLFVHFDDDRARASLETLAGFSSCQVLLFTHHRHLVDIAMNLPGERIALVEI